MTLEHALALFAAMPAADQNSLLSRTGIDMRTVVAMSTGCGCWRCTKHRQLFIAAVSAKADEIERVMLAEQKTEGSV